MFDLQAMLVASALKAHRQHNANHQRAMDDASRAAVRKIAGEYGHLRVRKDGYDLGNNPDPSGLLPTVFPDGTDRRVDHPILTYQDRITAHLRLSSRKVVKK